MDGTLTEMSACAFIATLESVHSFDHTIEAPQRTRYGLGTVTRTGPVALLMERMARVAESLSVPTSIVVRSMDSAVGVRGATSPTRVRSLALRQRPKRSQV